MEGKNWKHTYCCATTLYLTPHCITLHYLQRGGSNHAVRCSFEPICERFLLILMWIIIDEDENENAISYLNMRNIPLNYPSC